MSSTSFLKQVLSGFAESLQPLRESVASPELFAEFLQQFGWTLAPADLTQLTGSLGDLSSLAADPSSLSLEQLTGDLISAGNVIRRISGSGAPAAFASTFPRELLDFLVYSALAESNPQIFGLLHFVGALSERRVPADGNTGRTEYISREVYWERLGLLSEQPLVTIEHSYGWGGDFDSNAFIRSLGILILGFGGRGGLYPADSHLVDQYYVHGSPAAAGAQSLILSAPMLEKSVTGGGAAADVKLAFLTIPIPPSPDVVAAADGLAMMPVITGNATDALALSDRVTLKLSGDFLVRPVRAELHPGSAIVRASGGDTHVEAVARLDAKAPAGTPWMAFGNTDSSRLEVAVVHASLGMQGDVSGELDLQVEVGLDSATLVIDLEEGDSFVQDSLGSQTARCPVSLLVKWSSRSGFSLGGQPRLAITLPVRQSLGDVATLDSVAFALGAAGGNSVALDATLTFSASIGPVTAAIADAGVRTLLTPVADATPPGNLGNVDLQFGFKPPTGVGLRVDSAAVTGGGFLFHDPAQGSYAGVMQLTLHDELTLTAYGLIATRLPDGSRGYSLLIFITAEGFKPVPLGFGFQLEAIGGMVGVHRTFDQDVIKAGLQTDTLATLLFPRDPVANAPALIQALAAAFPAKQGSYLLGLVARITWFTPTLVRLDLALILELGARTRLLALGRVSALLPSADDDLIRLNLDALGVLDFDAGTLACDAVLVDSRLAHQFPVTGSAALRACWPGGGAPAGASFVLAAGGLNPRFTPPAAFPPLDRVAIALCPGTNPRLVCDAYLAVTANTVQFGAQASLFAEALGFSVTGDLGFDALVTLLPPHFIVDFHASVQLKRGSHNLFKVTLDGTLEGPLPLRLAAKATFEILWVSFSVHFDFTLTAGDLAQAALPAVALATELAKALADPGSWSTRRAAGAGHGVALRGLAPGPALVLDPLGQLVVRQQVAPLNTGRDVDTYDGAPVAGPRRFALTATLDGTASTTEPGAFAPARYFTMSDDEKLTAPSFEVMDAGLVIGDGAARFDAAAIVPAPLAYEAIVLNPDPPGTAPPALPAPSRYQLPAAALTVQSRSGAAARVPARRAGRARFRTATVNPAATLAAPRWRIVRASDGTVAPEDPGVTTWSDYRAALAALNRGGARWLMVPVHELNP